MPNEVLILPISSVSLPDKARKHLGIAEGGQIKIELLSNQRIGIYSVNESSGFTGLNLRSFGVEQEFERLKKRVAFYEHEWDANADEFIDGICRSIIDSLSAFGASHIYTGEWFRNLGYSIEKKIGFCRQLIDTVSPYNPSYVSDLWRNVVNGNRVAIDAIDVRDVQESNEDV